MAAATALLLASMARKIIQPHQISSATAKQMLEREMFLHQELIHLLQELENSKSEEGRLFSGWLFWTTAVALLLIVFICWRARQRRKLQSLKSVKVYCPDLPENIEKIEIGLSVYDNKRPKRNRST